MIPPENFSRLSGRRYLVTFFPELITLAFQKFLVDNGNILAQRQRPGRTIFSTRKFQHLFPEDFLFKPVSF